MEKRSSDPEQKFLWTESPENNSEEIEFAKCKKNAKMTQGLDLYRINFIVSAIDFEELPVRTLVQDL